MCSVLYSKWTEFSRLFFLQPVWSLYSRATSPFLHLFQGYRSSEIYTLLMSSSTPGACSSSDSPLGHTKSTECSLRKRASITALDNEEGSTFSCICSIVTQPLICILENDWLYAGLSVIDGTSTLVLAVTTRLLGPKWSMAIK
jgi:hypothetical protein